MSNQTVKPEDPLFLALDHKDIPKAITILEQYVKEGLTHKLLEPNHEGETALHKAIRFENTWTDEFLKWWLKALDLAFQDKSDEAILKLLLLDDKFKYGMNYISGAIYAQNKKILLQCLKNLKPESRMSMLSANHFTGGTLLLNLMYLFPTGQNEIMKEIFDLIPDKSKLRSALIQVLPVMINNRFSFLRTNELLTLFGAPPISITVFNQGTEAILEQVCKTFPELNPILAQFIEHSTQGKSSRQLFEQANMSALTHRFKKTIEGIAEDPILLSDPLAKSQHTVNLERITHLILQGPPVTVKTEPREDRDNDYYITFTLEKGTTEEYNLSETLRFANLQHVSLASQDMEKYLKFQKEYEERIKKENSDPVFSELFKCSLSEQAIQTAQQKPKYAALSSAEITAINVYSGNTFRGIQRLLDGQLDQVKPKGSISIEEACVHTVMASSGLNKIPNTETNLAYRWNAPWKGEALKEKPKVGPFVERGYTSASLEKPTEKIWFSPTEAIVYQGSLLGKDISEISRYPEDREFLMLPGTQFYVKAHFVEHGMHYYLISMYRSPSHLPEEALLRAKNVDSNILQKVTQNAQSFLEYLREFETELKKTSNDTVFIPIISNLQKITEELLRDTQHVVEDKLKTMQAALQNALKEVQAQPESKMSMAIIQEAFNEFKAISLNTYSDLKEHLKRENELLSNHNKEIKSLLKSVRDREEELDKFIKKSPQSSSIAPLQQEIANLKDKKSNLIKEAKVLEKKIHALAQEKGKIETILEHQGFVSESKQTNEATYGSEKAPRRKPMLFIKHLRSVENKEGKDTQDKDRGPKTPP